MSELPSLHELVDSANLPTIPAVAIEIISLVEKEDLAIDTLVDVIIRDPALATRVLKTANSGFYGRPRSVTTVRDAVVVLGLRAVKTLALGFSLVAELRSGDRAGTDHVLIWQRSLLAAIAAREVATIAGYPCADDAFLGGLLHLIGVVAMDQVFGERFMEVVGSAGGDFTHQRALERNLLGFDHAEAGAAVAEKWNLPYQLVMAIRLFPRPGEAPDDYKNVVRCVATAEAAAELVLGLDPATAITRFRQDCLQLLGIEEDAADALAARVVEVAAVLGSTLGVPDTGISPELVMTRAREALLQLSLESERENAQLHAERDRLTREASHDPLTGLPNRRRLEEFLSEQFRISARYGTPLSLILLDIDHFKRVNDTYGHPSGDEVLRQFANTISRTIRDADLCARFGGEEFVVVLPATGLKGAIELAERLRGAVETSMFPVDGHQLAITLSAGVSAYRNGEQADPGWLIKEADLALYEAKSAGRNQVHEFGSTPTSPWSLAG